MKLHYSKEFSPPALVLPVRVAPLWPHQGVEISAKIDTGADISVIPESLRRSWRPRPSGGVWMRGVSDTAARREPTYLIRILLDSDHSYVVKVLALPRKDVLLGRDVLNQFVLHADGPGKVFELTFELSGATDG